MTFISSFKETLYSFGTGKSVVAEIDVGNVLRKLWPKILDSAISNFWSVGSGKSVFSWSVISSWFSSEIKEFISSDDKFFKSSGSNSCEYICVEKIKLKMIRLSNRFNIVGGL